jgi:UDP:flavonoid glycosyltransferase YjiC (YdhE family)
MRVLVVPPPSPTHLAAMVPFCWALRSAGHNVLVACQPDIIGSAHAAGLNAASLGEKAHLTDQVGRFLMQHMFPVEAFGDRDSSQGRRLWKGAADTFAAHAEKHLDDYLALTKAWQPDLVLYDHLTVVGRLITGITGTPGASFRWGIDPTAGPFETRAHDLLAPLCRRHGLEQLPEPTFIIDHCPVDLQVEDAKPGRAMRFVPHNGTGVLPDWVHDRKTRHRVAICMGATVLTLSGPEPVLAAIEALSELDDLEIVVAVTADQREELGTDLPDQVRVVESLPLNLFIETCDVLVCAGGAGTGLTATSFGVPQLVMPQWTDQFDYARRLADSGAGLNVPDAAGQSDVEHLRESLDRLLSEPSFRAAAQRLRREMAVQPPLHEVVADLIALV